jgi:hypothetical protein
MRHARIQGQQVVSDKRSDNAVRAVYQIHGSRRSGLEIATLRDHEMDHKFAAAMISEGISQQADGVVALT